MMITGDVCCAMWEPAEHWMQMRLWTQARHMGIAMATCVDAALQETCLSAFVLQHQHSI